MRSPIDMKAQEPAIMAYDALFACCARAKGAFFTALLREYPCFPCKQRSKALKAHLKTAHSMIYKTAVCVKAIALGSAYADLRKRADA